MPLKKCTIDGSSGWKWGDSGKCFKNKKDALRQGAAIEISKQQRGKASNLDEKFFLSLTKEEQVDIMHEAGLNALEQFNFLVALHDNQIN